MVRRNNDHALPLQSEGLAAEQTSRDAGNHLLAQPVLGNENENAAFASKRDAWKNNEALVPIKCSDLPPNENVIGSHTVFERKDWGRVKTQTVPWGHCDSVKNEP